MTDFFLYVGTYTHGESKGIYIYRLNLENDIVRFIGAVEGIANPSFLAVSPNSRCLFSVSEVDNYRGQHSGAVCSYLIDGSSGHLTHVSTQISHGTYPCYLCVDKTSRFVLAANYGNGSASVFPIWDGGELESSVDTVQHRGSGKDPVRQESAHAHCICLDPTNRYAYIADLGLDKIMLYQFDPFTGKLTPNTQQSWVEVAAGSGPRHLVFHPDEAFAYLINELNSTITVFSYNRGSGTLEQLQTVTTLPNGFTGDNTGADIHISPGGRFLYGSNRGRDEIVIFSIEKGRLTGIGRESTQGTEPRNFIVEPSGNFLLAANQDTDSITIFQVEGSSGKLKSTRQIKEIPSPVCLQLIQTSGTDC